MATLTLDRVWVNRIDSGQAVSALSDVDRQQEYSIAGDVRTYAGGRQRSIVTAGERGKFQVTLKMVNMAQILLLRSWMGIPVAVRDARGQRVVGVFRTVPVRERREVGEYDVTLSVETVSIVEGV